MLTKSSIYLLKQLKISFQTLFHTKQFSVMTEIHRGSVTKLKNYLIRKILLTNPIFKMVKNEQSFQVFQAIQNMLLSAIEVSKQKYYSWISKNLMDSSTSP